MGFIDFTDPSLEGYHADLISTDNKHSIKMFIDPSNYVIVKDVYASFDETKKIVAEINVAYGAIDYYITNNGEVVEHEGVIRDLFEAKRKFHKIFP